jgi:hypothetical protein
LAISEVQEKRPRVTSEANSTPMKSAKASKMKLLKIKTGVVTDVTQVLSSRRSEDMKREDFLRVTPR